MSPELRCQVNYWHAQSVRSHATGVRKRPSSPSFRLGCLREMRARPVDDAPGIHHACCSGYNPSAAEQQQSRNARDPEFGGDPRLVVRIELDEPDVRFEFSSSFFEHGRHRPAGAAPGRPNVHENGDIVLASMLVKICGPHRERAAFEQGAMTATAPRVARRPIRWQTIDCRAVRTDNVSKSCHGSCGTIS